MRNRLIHLPSLLEDRPISGSWTPVRPLPEAQHVVYGGPVDDWTSGRSDRGQHMAQWDTPDGEGTADHPDVPMVPPPAAAPGGPNHELGGFDYGVTPGSYGQPVQPTPPPPGAYGQPATGAMGQPGQPAQPDQPARSDQPGQQAWYAQSAQPTQPAPPQSDVYGRPAPPAPPTSGGNPYAQYNAPSPGVAYGQYNVPPSVPYGQVPASQTNGFAITALVLGLLSLVMPCFLILGLGGVGFGIAGMKKASELGDNGRGMAIAGIVLGGISVVLFVVFVVWVSAYGTFTID